MLRQRIGSLPFSKNIKTMIRYFEELDHLDKQLFIKHLVNLDQSTVQKYISELIQIIYCIWRKSRTNWWSTFHLSHPLLNQAQSEDYGVKRMLSII